MSNVKVQSSNEIQSPNDKIYQKCFDIKSFEIHLSFHFFMGAINSKVVVATTPDSAPEAFIV